MRAFPQSGSGGGLIGSLAAKSDGVALGVHSFARCRQVRAACGDVDINAADNKKQGKGLFHDLVLLRGARGSVKADAGNRSAIRSERSIRR
ncbi:hypothetical protein AA0472_0325 [Acetobacter estunensis NRIC 0472]|nr:hypothetical protein AA0472_0325 [Acetobacter estunensis NRIC 0472]